MLRSRSTSTGPSSGRSHLLSDATIPKQTQSPTDGTAVRVTQQRDQIGKCLCDPQIIITTLVILALMEDDNLKINPRYHRPQAVGHVLPIAVTRVNADSALYEYAVCPPSDPAATFPCASFSCFYLQQGTTYSTVALTCTYRDLFSKRGCYLIHFRRNILERCLLGR